MEFMDVKKLKPHRDNSFYFDDMEGEPWSAFLESIRTSGIIEPIIVTQDLTIVSGHQRVRAAKKLGIDQVAVEIRNYDSDDEVLKQLIETNICQRGIGNLNSVKFGRCISELERISGIRNGGDHGNQYKKADGNNFQLAKTQDDLAAELGMSKRQLANYKALTNIVPELQDMVDNGISMTGAVAIARKLSPEEQKRLAEEIGGKEKVSNREVDFYIKRVQALTEENKELREREPVIRTILKEVIPDDYEETKEKLEKAERAAEEANTAKKAIYDAAMKEKLKNLATDIDVIIGRYRSAKEFADYINGLIEVRKTIVV